MENTKFLKLVIVLLLLTNTGILAFLWMGRHNNKSPMGPPQGRDAFSFLCKELQLDEQQTRQYEELRDEHHQAVENMQHNGRHLRERFFDLLHSSPLDSVQVKQLSDSIAHTQQQIELLTFYHFQKVRAILRPEQQKKFDDVIQDALRMMGPGAGGPPPPPPPAR